MQRWDVVIILGMIFVGLGSITAYVHNTQGADQVITLWVIGGSISALVIGFSLATINSRITTRGNVEVMEQAAKKSGGGNNAETVREKQKLLQLQMDRDDVKRGYQISESERKEAAQIAAQNQAKIPSWQVVPPRQITGPTGAQAGAAEYA